MLPKTLLLATTTLLLPAITFAAPRAPPLEPPLEPPLAPPLAPPLPLPPRSENMTILPYPFRGGSDSNSGTISLSERDTCGSCHTCGNGQKVCGLCNSGACSVCVDGKDCVTHEGQEGLSKCCSDGSGCASVSSFFRFLFYTWSGEHADSILSSVETLHGMNCRDLS